MNEGRDSKWLSLSAWTPLECFLPVAFLSVILYIAGKGTLVLPNLNVDRREGWCGSERTNLPLSAAVHWRKTSPCRSQPYSFLGPTNVTWTLMVIVVMITHSLFNDILLRHKWKAGARVTFLLVDNIASSSKGSFTLHRQQQGLTQSGWIRLIP